MIVARTASPDSYKTLTSTLESWLIVMATLQLHYGILLLHVSRIAGPVPSLQLHVDCEFKIRAVYLQWVHQPLFDVSLHFCHNYTKKCNHWVSDYCSFAEHGTSNVNTDLILKRTTILVYTVIHIYLNPTSSTKTTIGRPNNPSLKEHATVWIITTVIHNSNHEIHELHPICHFAQKSRSYYTLSAISYNCTARLIYKCTPPQFMS